MFDLFFFQALAAKESRMRGATGQRNTMGGRESRGRTVFSVMINRKKQEIEGIRLVNGRGGGRGGRELCVGYIRAD